MMDTYDFFSSQLFDFIFFSDDGILFQWHVLDKLCPHSNIKLQDVCLKMLLNCLPDLYLNEYGYCLTEQ